MPTQEGVGRHDRGDVGEETTTERLALRSEPATLVIGEAESTTAELLLEDSVLLDEVRDNLGLFAVDPAGEGGEQELKREEVGHHAR